MPGLFVAPIDPRAEEADIDDLFKDFGRVTNIQWKKGHSSNYIFCELDDMDAAEAAMDKLIYQLLLCPVTYLSIFQER